MSGDWRGTLLNITCNFVYYNHQVHRDFLITLYYTSLNIVKCFKKHTLSSELLCPLCFTFTGRDLESSLWVAWDNHTAYKTIFVRINLTERYKYFKFNLCVWEGLIIISIWPQNRVPRHFLCSWFCPIPFKQMCVITTGVP
jgi:hypothetical protein